MQVWEYCEVAWTPKQVIVHVYSSRKLGTYEGVERPELWGDLLAQLGADGWEMVGTLPAKPVGHALYYFKRPIEANESGSSSASKEEWETRAAKLRESTERHRAQRAQQKVAVDPAAPPPSNPDA